MQETLVWNSKERGQKSLPRVVKKMVKINTKSSISSNKTYKHMANSSKITKENSDWFLELELNMFNLAKVACKQ